MKRAARPADEFHPFGAASLVGPAIHAWSRNEHQRHEAPVNWASARHQRKGVGEPISFSWPARRRLLSAAC
jgi:hypothetical protein